MTMPVMDQPATSDEDLLDGQAGDMQWHAPPATADQARIGVDPVTGLGRFESLVKGHVDPVAAEKQVKEGTGGPLDKILELAKSQLGVNYVYGAHQWGKALDCSGFTQEVFARAGINIGSNTYSQVTQGSAVEGGLGNAKPGDLIFLTGDKGMRVNGHVGIYLGGGKVINAPHTGTVVQIQDWSNRTPTAIRRYF
jgi:cell wall-associated NlpC family hydrolase